ncbi:MAG: MOSC domain-containing protein [Burkholderiaceae bacterium]
MNSFISVLTIALASGKSSPIPGEPGKHLRSSIAKTPTQTPVEITTQGLLGDVTTDTRFHGGPDQALLVMGEADYQYWELGHGPTEPLGSLPRGLFGENLILDGWTSYDACVGDRLVCDDWCLEVTAPRSPCNTFTRIMRHRAGGWADRFRAAERPGAYVRVIKPGLLKLDQTVRVEPYVGERLRIADMLHAKWRTLTTDAQLESILELPISAHDRALFTARLNGTAAT